MKSPARAKAKGSKPAVAKAGAAVSHAPPPAPSGGIDPALIRQIAEVLDSASLTEIEVQFESLRIRVARQAASVTQVVQGPQAAPVAIAPGLSQAAAAVSPAPSADDPGLIKSPMVGTVYRRANPDAKPFIEVGATVKAGERILLVEAMKTFNDIVAPRAGTVTQIFVEDGQPVEYDQPLVVVV